MVLQKNEVPEGIRPYLFHGMDLTIQGKQANGDCPFCGRENKFSVDIEKGLYRCLVCAEGNQKGGGNPIIFIRKLHNLSFEKTKGEAYNQLAKERKLLYPETLIQWQICQSLLTNTWLIPGYNGQGAMNQLYKYVKNEKGKYRLYSTATLSQGIHGIEFGKKKKKVFLCEGIWDAMALWEILGNSQVIEGNLTVTANRENSLLKDSEIYAVPGANIFTESWGEIFAGAEVIMLYDSDHPQKRDGKTYPPVGIAGMKRATHIMTTLCEEGPESIHYLKWGKNGYDDTKPDGWDLRDYLSQGSNLRERVKLLSTLLNTKIKPVPPEWIGTKQTTGIKGKPELVCLECTSWKELVLQWRKAMKWISGLDHALAVMISSIISTPILGDQLWVKIIGPPSCGKSNLCEAVSVNKKHVLAKSTIRGFLSGWGTKKDKDASLINKLRNKTLVTKDGDTLLTSPNLQQILSEARDIYDRVSRASYRTGIEREYENVSMTWVLCGTSSLRSLDSSELGERFLTCYIMEKIDHELEEEILWRVANQTDLITSMTTGGGSSETMYEPNKLKAMQLTGGYINYLKDNIKKFVQEVTISEESMKHIINLGRLVALLRARPSKKQDEVVEREFAPRLVSQLIRLAKCLAIVLNKKQVDEEVLERVKKVAFDTARGRTLEIVKTLAKYGAKGLGVSQIALYTNQGEDQERSLLKFLKKIEVVELFKQKIKGKMERNKWRLSPMMQTILTSVYKPIEAGE